MQQWLSKTQHRALEVRLRGAPSLRASPARYQTDGLAHPVAPPPPRPHHLTPSHTLPYPRASLHAPPNPPRTLLQGFLDEAWIWTDGEMRGCKATWNVSIELRDLTGNPTDSRVLVYFFSSTLRQAARCSVDSRPARVDGVGSQGLVVKGLARCMQGLARCQGSARCCHSLEKSGAHSQNLPPVAGDCPGSGRVQTLGLR